MNQIPNYDIDLIIKLRKQGATWEQVGGIYETAADNVRKWASRHERFHEIREEEKITDAVKEVIDRRTEDRRTGEITNEIKRRMREKKVFTDDELLELHALDPGKFKIRVVTSNEWTMTESGGEQYYNFQSKIVAEPLTEDDTLTDKLIDIINQYAKPFSTQTISGETLDAYLVIPFFDLHFGMNTAEDYAEYQEKILQMIDNQYKRVVIINGGDFFNTNDFRSQTINQTRVNDTNIPNAWEEAILFIAPVLEKALANSPSVEYVYNRSNHSETIDWAFSQYLKARYPQIIFDDDTRQLKVTELGETVFFSTHGHIRKQPKDLVNLCSAIYPTEWGKARRRFVITGHKHHDKEEDFPGATYVQLTSPSKATDYEDENLYLGTPNGMRLFEVTDEDLMSKHYL